MECRAVCTQEHGELTAEWRYPCVSRGSSTSCAKTVAEVNEDEDVDDDKDEEEDDDHEGEDGGVAYDDDVDDD
eukprot:5056793-Pyramimonas_sp.AAC.1